MSERDNNRDYYLDTYYEVWRNGGDADRLDRDRISDYRYNGYSPEEAAECEMRSWRRAAQKSQEEYEEEQMLEYQRQEYERREYERAMEEQAENLSQEQVGPQEVVKETEIELENVDKSAQDRR